MPRLVAQDHAGNLGPQLFLGVPLAPEGMRQVAVQPRRVAGPVPQLMERGCVVVVGARELAFVGQMDAVRGRPIKRAVVLAVADGGT